MAIESTSSDRSPRREVLSMLGAMMYQSWALGQRSGFAHIELPSHGQSITRFSAVHYLSNQATAEEAYTVGFGHRPAAAVETALKFLTTEPMDVEAVIKSLTAQPTKGI